MGFKVLIIADSDNLINVIESAFESTNIAVIRLSTDALQLSTEDLRTQVMSVVPNLVIASLINLGDADHMVGLVSVCLAENYPLISLSSYRVFGRGQEFLSESLTPEPDDPLGHRLMAIEQHALQHDRAIVLRIPWTLTETGDAILDAVCSGLLSGLPLQVSEDASGRVVSWDEVARTLVALTQQIFCGANNWGVFHLRSSDTCSEAEFADAVARLLRAEGQAPGDLIAEKGGSCLVERSALLHGRRCTDDFGIQARSFRIGLRGQVQKWLSAHGHSPL